MKAKKFLELNKAKGLALLSTGTITVLYITKSVVWVPEILMIFLGAVSLFRIKIHGIFLNEKKTEIKKGIYFSLAGLFFGFLLRIFGFNFLIEILLAVFIAVLLKEIYSQKKEKWINAFVLIGSFLIACETILLTFNLIVNQIFLP